VTTALPVRRILRGNIFGQREGGTRAFRWRVGRIAVLLLAFVSQVVGAELAGLKETRRRLQQGEPLRVVCFGDSITGVYYHTGGVASWSDLLGRFLKAAHPAAAVSVFNAGVSGNTTTAALARFERDVLSRAPQLVALMFGMNDLVNVPPEDFVRNLTTMVTRIRAAGAAVILLTPNHVQAGDSQRPPERVAAYAAMIREVAREMGVPLADCHRRFADEATAGGYRWARLMSDTIHPNLHGHQLIAAEVARVVLERLEEPEVGTEGIVSPRPPREWPKRDEVRILAMEPCDAMLRDFLREVAPDRPVRISTWPTAGKSLAELIEDTRRRGRWRSRPDLDGGRPNLIVLSLPLPGEGASDEALFREYSALINGSLSFGAPEWDLWVLLPPAPEALRPRQARSGRDIAQDVVASKGLAGAQVEHLRPHPHPLNANSTRRDDGG
jgi:lysophospholipase L1-like esterase